jgi:pyruvate formate lyase activating enzyme
MTAAINITGRIHSIETCGTVDGPGIRFVIFTQGCLLRCVYCHNPDTRDLEAGREVSVEEMITEISKYRSYMRSSGGGVTISGGEPLLQPQFIGEIFRRCQELDIHTALDTSGFPKFEEAKQVLRFVDLVLLDIKSWDKEIYHRVTGVALEPTIRFAQYLDEIHKPAWIRFVLVPGWTDDRSNVEGLAQFISTLRNVEKVEILPFHKMGEYKWKQMGYPYVLENTDIPTSELIGEITAIFKKYGLNIH